MTEEAKDNLATQELASVQAVLERYHAAVEQVAAQMGHAVALLESLYAEQDEMIERLKGILAKSCSLRHSDFDVVFANVLKDRRRTRGTLSALVEAYRANRLAVSEAIGSAFNENAAQAAQAWPALKERLLNENNAGMREVALALRRVHIEQEELRAALSGLLNRGERLKIRDVKLVAKNLGNRDSRQTAELSALLDMCETAGRNVGLAWLRLAS